MFDELVNEISKDILSHEQRKRLRTSDEQHRFKYTVRYILTDLWKASKSIPIRECLVNLRSGSYSETPRYRDPNLTYRQVKSVFDTMLSLRLIEITKDGYYDRVRLEGSLTCYTARDELQDRLLHLECHPAIRIKSDLDSETILLRNTIDGRRQLIPYKDTFKTESYRDNLRKINTCFIKHWPDLRIKDTEVNLVSNLIENDSEREPIDLSSRTLVRIFSNGSFEQGGRFYRGWWQNVPSDYRKFITIDSKQTTEYDFSQLNPHMIYHRYGYELGSEDAYDRVLDGQHRDTVKEAFNAMIQTSTPLRNCPSKINIDHIGMSWAELRKRVLAAHKPINHLFFTGLGNRLQFEDSCMAESVMLQFAKIDAPALPVHDSFVMHHGYGYGCELEEFMRRAYYERFNEDIKVKEEIIKEIQAPDIEKQPDLTADELIKGEEEYSEWQERDRMWWAEK